MTTKYMAHGKSNKTGPIEKKPDKAVQAYFRLYPKDDVCYLSIGEECGNGIFIAKMGSVSNEIKREDVRL